jgi:transposase, IS5 family
MRKNINLENEAKIWRSIGINGTKKVSNPHIGYKLHCIIHKDYVLIKRFKTITASLHEFPVDLI